jgi:hypothetical protein
MRAGNPFFKPDFMSLLSPSIDPKQANPKWRILALGLGLVLLAAGAGFFLIRGDHAPEPTAPDAYAARMRISDIKMSRAENLVGGTVTYIDGKITNTGDKTVTDARVETTFWSAMDAVAQKERSGLRILKYNGAYDDSVDFATVPLAPGQSAQFRLTFEHISAEWNQNFPEIRVLRVATK